MKMGYNLEQSTDEAERETGERQRSILVTVSIPEKPPHAISRESEFLDRLRAVSVLRAKEDFKTYDNAGLLYFTTATAGELGELCNLVKKLERAKHGGPDAGHTSKLRDITPEKLQDEIGGIFIYLDLLASLLGINVQEAITVTFNRVSKEIGSKYQL